jgi:replication-associated recombination protein RarA
MTFYKITTVRGYAAPECVSALQKAIRRCDDQQALYWAVELDRSGLGFYVWRRLLIMVSEDIGLAEPGLPAQIFALYSTWREMNAWNNRNHPERLMFTHAVLLMARAKKSRTLDHATHVAYTINDRLYDIPDYALDFHTREGKRRGNGLDHWYAEAATLNNQVPVDDPWEDWSRRLAYDDTLPTPLEKKASKKEQEDEEEPPTLF